MSKTRCCGLNYVGENHNPIWNGVCRNCNCIDIEEIKKNLICLIPTSGDAVTCHEHTLCDHEVLNVITALELKLSQSVKENKKLRECLIFIRDHAPYIVDAEKAAKECLKEITKQRESDEL